MPLGAFSLVERPGRVPMPFELRLARLCEEFGVRSVEHATTRATQASPAELAKDLYTAFGDSVFTNIGGEDQIKPSGTLTPRSCQPGPIAWP